MPYYGDDDDLRELFGRMFDSSPTTRIAVNGIKSNQWYIKMNEKHTHKQEYLITQMTKKWQLKEIKRNFQLERYNYQLHVAMYELLLCIVWLGIRVLIYLFECLGAFFVAYYLR